MIENGLPDRLGAWQDGEGVNFALYANAAEAVELCLYDQARNEIARHFLPAQSDGVWHGYLPECSASALYGYRVHGRWAPLEGFRYNPAKLLIDPYSRRLEGEFRWNPAVYDFESAENDEAWTRNEQDSAPYVPLSTINQAGSGKGSSSAWVPWAEMILYEANVRGFTMRHPGLSEQEKGRFNGLKNGQILEYLKALGITSVELMPVHAMIDEAFLVEKGLRNLWGYNSIQFFAPDNRFASVDPVSEFREMVASIHEAGLEVILDAAYNHTGEGNERGPTVSFRGIDSQSYYSHEPDKPWQHINDTGCGNTLNSNHPRVQDLVIDSLVYWHREMGVDGFRFDLATVLGRKRKGFSRKHPLLTRMSIEPELYRAKLIAEPWDPGPGGYQLGNFPIEWAELNDRYRDTVRRYWRGDDGQSSEFARRIHGSADLFERGGRDPVSSINFVSSHDGYTLRDVVTYEKRHNEANLENNRDGHRQNFSSNYGVEGETDDPEIRAVRRQQRLNLLATLLFSQGTPMILAGDEFGNGQGGNNNAYAQDNEIGWLDWSQSDQDPEFTAKVRRLIHLRRNLPLLRQNRYVHGRMPTDQGFCDINWLHPDGRPMLDGDWHNGKRIALFFTCHEEQHEYSPVTHAIAILYNASPELVAFGLPTGLGKEWELRFASCERTLLVDESGSLDLPGRSLALVTLGLEV